MKKIFWGFLLIFIDINIGSGSFKIDLLPDFVGEILLLYGMKELQNESRHFNDYLTLAKGFIVVSVCSFVIGLLVQSVLINIVISIVSVVLFIILSYHIVKGIADIQDKYSVYMEAEALYSCWVVIAVCTAMGILVYIIQFLAIIYFVIMLLVTILFLIKLSTAKTKYEKILACEEI